MDAFYSSANCSGYLQLKQQQKDCEQAFGQSLQWRGNIMVLGLSIWILGDNQTATHNKYCMLTDQMLC